MFPTTLISGGQTGADRAAFDVAFEHSIPIRGWVPRGRLAEDGVIPSRYPNLRETKSADPAERTEMNVRDADGTLILSHGPLTGGSQLTEQLAKRLRRPALHVDLSRTSQGNAVKRILDWLAENSIDALNVAGPRASEDPHIYEATRALLREVLITSPC